VPVGAGSVIVSRKEPVAGSAVTASCGVCGCVYETVSVRDAAELVRGL
jgi:hypothetical protein